MRSPGVCEGRKTGVWTGIRIATPAARVRNDGGRRIVRCGGHFGSAAKCFLQVSLSGGIILNTTDFGREEGEPMAEEYILTQSVTLTIRTEDADRLLA